MEDPKEEPRKKLRSLQYFELYYSVYNEMCLACD